MYYCFCSETEMIGFPVCIPVSRYTMILSCYVSTQRIHFAQYQSKMQNVLLTGQSSVLEGQGSGIIGGYVDSAVRRRKLARSWVESKCWLESDRVDGIWQRGHKIWRLGRVCVCVRCCVRRCVISATGDGLHGTCGGDGRWHETSVVGGRGHATGAV